MDIEVKKNIEHFGTWDLFVNGRLEVEAETFPIVDGIRASLDGSYIPPMELQDVARAIREDVESCKYT